MTARTPAQAAAACARQSTRGPSFGIGECKLRVRLAYNVPSDGSPSAAVAWTRTQYRHPVPADLASIPDGALLWWTGGSHGFGHVAIKWGTVRGADGRFAAACWSTDLRRAGRFDRVPVADVHARWGLTLAGWSEDIDGVRVLTPVTATDAPKMPPLPAGWWNLKVGRTPDVVVREVRRLLDGHGLAVLGVCETGWVDAHGRYHSYLPALRHGLGRDYRVVGYPHRAGTARDRASAAETALIVRRAPKGPGVRWRRLHQLETAGWLRKPGLRRLGLHEPRRSVSARVAWCRLIAVHLPPHPGAAMGQAIAGLTRLLTSWTLRRRRWAAPGDYNIRSGDRRATDLAAATGATLTGTRIDYVLAHRATATGYRRLDGFGHSDHAPVLFTLNPGK
jgi:hypothetical protein